MLRARTGLRSTAVLRLVLALVLALVLVLVLVLVLALALATVLRTGKKPFLAPAALAPTSAA